MKHDNYSSGLWHECDDQILGDDGLVIFRATENPLVKNQHMANVQRAVACVNAFDGIETGRLAGKGLGEFLAGEVRLNKAESQPDGSFGFTFSGFAVQIMAESFADQFRESGAVNYLELLFEHKEIGPLTVTMQRTQGLTPAQKLAKAEAERDELVRQVSELQLSQQNIINAFGISGEGAHSKLVIEYVHGLVAENKALKSFGNKLDEMHNDLNGSGTGIQGGAEVACQQVALEAAMEEFDAIKTPATDDAIAEIKSEEAQTMYESILDNPSVYDMESLVDYLESYAENKKSFAANLRAGRKG